MNALDTVLVKWLHDRGYQTRYYGDGHIHIFSNNDNLVRPGPGFPFQEISIVGDTLYIVSVEYILHKRDMIPFYTRGGDIVLQLADPELFDRLGMLFPSFTKTFRLVTRIVRCVSSARKFLRLSLVILCVW